MRMPSLRDIEDAAARLRHRVLRTPLVFSPYLSRYFGASVHLKLENLQNTGSFKVRGATYKLLLEKGERALKEVVAASAGNHAQGVALAAREAGLKATIVMPEWASISKQEATRGYGGNVILSGKTVAQSLKAAEALAGKDALLIHPFDDLRIIAGQGTVGLEILEDLDKPDKILVPVGGGGLAAGIAVAVKSRCPQTRIIGVQAAACPSALRARRLGKRVQVAAGPTLADGIAVPRIGKTPFKILERHVTALVGVEEESIASAVLMLLEKKKILAEGAGAAPLAALLEGHIRVTPGEKIVLVISGGNMDSPLIGRIINQGLLRNGRVMRMTVGLEDVPGSLAALLSHVARLKGNVLHIRHQRNVEGLPINMSRVAVEVETRGFDHIRKIRSALKKAGYDLQGPLQQGF